MTTIRFNPALSDEARRQQLYDGQVLVHTPTAATRALCDFAHALITEAFAPHDPRRVHDSLPVERCVAILAALKPRFIHHPRAKQLLQALLREFDCDPQATYFDVPRLRSAMPRQYLASGIAYAFHPHRDTWYSAPQCQLNWWLPIYPLTPDNCMAFHPRYWGEPVQNSSRGYNYYRWNAESRGQAARHITSDTRVQPQAEQALELEPQLRVIAPPGGLILFSGAQLHSTVPNTAGVVRWSIDFRTINLADAAARRGAPNLDAACTGTTLRDYLRVSDLAPVPEAIVALHDDGVPADGVARYEATLG
jgi:hypothetical protein